MNLNRKVVESSIVAGMLVAMTATTSVTGQVASTVETSVVSDSVSVSEETRSTLSAGVIKEVSYVEEAAASKAGVSIEQSNAQVVALAEEPVETETIQAEANSVAQIEQTRALPVAETEATPIGETQDTEIAAEDAQANSVVAGATAVVESVQEENTENTDANMSVNAAEPSETEQATTETVAAAEQTLETSESEAVETEAGEDMEANNKAGMSAEVTVAEDTANAVQSDAVAAQLKAQEAEWENRLMPSVNEYLNIRSAGDENADIVGKLYKGDAAEIIERGEGWTHIKSGSVDGYVLNDYCTFGLEAYEQAKQDCQTEATVATGGLRLRTEPSEDAKVVDAAYEGQIFTVDTETPAADGWVAVEYENQVAYVSAQYVNVDISVGDAISIEEERAAQAAEAAEQAKQSAGTTQKEAVAASADEVTILGALIQLEAGSECYEGKVAVGAVVMNRVRSGSYPSSISGVVYQGGQFTTAASVNGVIANGVSGSCMQAAQEAINGADNTGGCVSFRRVSSGRGGVVIGNHVFF